MPSTCHVHSQGHDNENCLQADSAHTAIPGGEMALSTQTRLSGVSAFREIQSARMPSPHWKFNGKTVNEIYEEFHDSTDES
jgi:hypothetical protein